MSKDVVVRQLLDPLVRVLKAGEFAQTIYDKRREAVDAERRALGLEPSDSLADAREFSVVDHPTTQRSLSIHDAFGLTKLIEEIVAELREAGKREVAMQLESFLKNVDETGGDDQIPMQALREWLAAFFPIEPECDAPTANESTANPSGYIDSPMAEAEGPVTNRRGRDGKSPIERFAEIEQLFHRISDARVDDDTDDLQRTKRRCRNWLLRDWNKGHFSKSV